MYMKREGGMEGGRTHWSYCQVPKLYTLVQTYNLYFQSRTCKWQHKHTEFLHNLNKLVYNIVYRLQIPLCSDCVKILCMSIY